MHLSDVNVSSRLRFANFWTLKLSRTMTYLEGWCVILLLFFFLKKISLWTILSMLIQVPLSGDKIALGVLQQCIGGLEGDFVSVGLGRRLRVSP